MKNEIILVSLGDSTIIKKYGIDLKYYFINYHDVFWKTKAINFAVKKATGEFITLIDVDCLMTCNFIPLIETFFLLKEHSDAKLSYRVKYMDPTNTNSLCSIPRLSCQNISEICLNKITQYKKGVDKFCVSDKILFLEQLPPNVKNDPFLYEKYVAGYSQFTMSKSNFIKIGGFDERIIGWGSEDKDFNIRAHKFLNNGYGLPPNDLVLFHMYHEPSANWTEKQYYQRNKNILKENINKNIVKLPVNDKWGEF